MQIFRLHPGKKRIAGVYLQCPMIVGPCRSLLGFLDTRIFIKVSPESRPNAIVEFVGRVTQFFAGRYPFVNIVQGKETDDPRVAEELLSKRCVDLYQVAHLH